ncbi:hypothetical protein OROGR_019725 [Orobanche gracilis]
MWHRGSIAFNLGGYFSHPLQILTFALICKPLRNIPTKAALLLFQNLVEFEKKGSRNPLISYLEFTMAKRELSSTLKNLKFMQRGAQKDEKNKKEEEVLPAGDFPSSSAVKRCMEDRDRDWLYDQDWLYDRVWLHIHLFRQCGPHICWSIRVSRVVIVEGDPYPGATRGRMSFLSFNPSIDKLNGEAADHSETGSAVTSSGRQNEVTPIRENRSAQFRSENVDLNASNSPGYSDFKRKQAEVTLEAQYPTKLRKNDQYNPNSTPNSSRTSQKQHKREKLEWSVLQPPKYKKR